MSLTAELIFWPGYFGLCYVFSPAAVKYVWRGKSSPLHTEQLWTDAHFWNRRPGPKRSPFSYGWKISSFYISFTVPGSFDIQHRTAVCALGPRGNADSRRPETLWKKAARREIGSARNVTLERLNWTRWRKTAGWGTGVARRRAVKVDNRVKVKFTLLTTVCPL